MTDHILSFFRDNPEWMFFVSFATPWVILLTVVITGKTPFKFGRKGEFVTISELPVSETGHFSIVGELPKLQRRKDVSPDFFDNITKYHNAI